MQLENTFFLISGLIALAFSYGHVVGVRRFFSALTPLPQEVQQAVKIFMYQSSITLLISGVVLIELAFIASDTFYTAAFIALINFANLLFFAVYTLRSNRNMFRNHALHMVIMFLWIGLIVDGIIF